MWKLLGILLILWELLADWLEPFVRSRFGKLGLSLYGMVLLYSRLRERAQGRILEARVTALEEGKRWDAGRKNLSENSNLGRFTLSQVVRFLARIITLFIRRTGTGKSILRRRNMKINKTWIVGLLGYIAYFVKQFWPDANIPDELLNNIADVILLIVAIVPMIVNMRKPKDREHPWDKGVNTSAQRTNTFTSNK